MALGKKKDDKKKLDEIINSSPDETTTSKDMLKRQSLTFRGNRKLWLDFDYWCKTNKFTRSDLLEDFFLEKMEKNKDDYR